MSCKLPSVPRRGRGYNEAQQPAWDAAASTSQGVCTSSCAGHVVDVALRVADCVLGLIGSTCT